jgi:hypothetical protein
VPISTENTYKNTVSSKREKKGKKKKERKKERKKPLTVRNKKVVMWGEGRHSMLPDLLHSHFIDTVHSAEESGKYTHSMHEETLSC